MWRCGKNRHITPNVSEYSGPTLTYFTGLVVGMIFQVFVWRSPKGRCYGNQLNMGDVRKRRVGPPLLFASAFDNRLADHKSAFKWSNGNNHATLCPNLVNFCPVISEFTLLKRAIFAAIRPSRSFIDCKVFFYTDKHVAQSLYHSRAFVPISSYLLFNDFWKSNYLKIFAIFSPYESASRAHDGSVPVQNTFTVFAVVMQLNVFVLLQFAKWSQKEHLSTWSDVSW